MSKSVLQKTYRKINNIALPLIEPLVETIRPKQSLKAVFVLAPLIFSLNFDSWMFWKNSLLAMLSFWFLSCGAYIINDLLDKTQDQNHFKKKHRPIPSGRLKTPTALAASLLMFSLAFLAILFLPTKASQISVSCVLIAYLFLQVAYNLYFKKVAILDVISIASGFVLRVIAGGVAIDVAISPFIIVCTFFLTMFQGFAKRYNELGSKNNSKNSHHEHDLSENLHTESLRTENLHTENLRPSLRDYNKEFLSILMTISSGLALFSYVYYTVKVGERLEKPLLIYTCMFVTFGIFRYMQFVYLKKEGGSPEDIFFKDKIFLLNSLVWLSTTVYILST